MRTADDAASLKFLHLSPGPWLRGRGDDGEACVSLCDSDGD